MKCSYHPQEEAVNNCSLCRKPLCEKCGEQRAGANVLCSRCAALSAARAAATGEDERQAEHEEKKIVAAKKGKKPHVAMITVIILSVIVLVANIYMYMGPSVPDVEPFDPYKHPLLTADLINDGIEDYAGDHGGVFPGKLTDLLGKYLPYEKMTSSVLDMFSYRRFTPQSYELRFKDADNEEFSDIVFGKEDT
ncbi:MAG: hypothetical protein GY846_02050 [Deltaproteobacteria bacterium]|nr:hypothetical protein [Deltaproteobacteria bacterium]